jgi:hypothetical protein
MLYHLRYAWRLYTRVPGMTLLDAWRYPFDPKAFDGDPIEDADCEISYMAEHAA